MPKDVVSYGGAVGSPHPEAAAAGKEILEKGGNAIDAAVAAVLTCCVVLPDNVGIGGYGGCMVVYLADEKRVVAIDFDARCQLAFSPDVYKADPNAAQRGYLSVTAPAVIAGLALALEEFGTMSWTDVSKRALRLAEEGFKLHPGLAQSLEALAKNTDETSFKAQFPDGRVPKAGDLFVQKDLAKLLKVLAKDGPTSLYQGDIPKKIVRQVRKNGGILSEEDFSITLARLTEPISVKHKGYTIYAPPLPSGALTSLQVLKTMEYLGVDSLEAFSPRYFHLLSEALKAAWQDRSRYFGDPHVVDMPFELFLSDENARETASRIQNGRTANKQVHADSASHTVHVVAADAKQNMVSVTATQGEIFGSRVVIDGLGLVLGHGMSRFDYSPQSPNYPCPGKRMQHNMSPVIVLKGGRPYCAMGLPGGPKIVSVTAQLLIDLLDFNTGMSGAIDAPRIHTQGSEPLTAKMDDDTARGLEALGHKVTMAKKVAGPASGIVIDESNGACLAAAEAGPDAVGVVRESRGK